MGGGSEDQKTEKRGPGSGGVRSISVCETLVSLLFLGRIVARKKKMGGVVFFGSWVGWGGGLIRENDQRGQTESGIFAT